MVFPKRFVDWLPNKTVGMLAAYLSIRNLGMETGEKPLRKMAVS